MRRREFITLIGGAATWPLATRAQQRAKPPRIGFLGLAFEPTAGEWLGAGLRDLGYIEGTNIIIEWQWAQNVDELPALVAELVRMDVDVIFAPSSTSPTRGHHISVSNERHGMVLRLDTSLHSDPMAIVLCALAPASHQLERSGPSSGKSDDQELREVVTTLERYRPVP
jgi:hypothetical protein